MPKFLHDKLKAQYGVKSKVPYAIMNKIGAMRGNRTRTTAKGRAMEAKHRASTSPSPSPNPKRSAQAIRQFSFSSGRRSPV